MSATRAPIRPPAGKGHADRRADPRRRAPRRAGVTGRIRSWASEATGRVRTGWSDLARTLAPARRARPTWLRLPALSGRPTWLRLPALSARPTWLRLPARRARPTWLRLPAWFARPTWLRLPAWFARPTWLRLPGWFGGEPTVRPITRSGTIDPRIHQRRIDVSRRRGRRRLRTLVALAALACLVLAGWFVLHSGLMSARVVTVVGMSHTPSAEVVAAAGLDAQPPLIDVAPGTAAARVERLPWVLRATVSRQWPDGVRIAVVERVPVAVVNAGSSGWAEVDRTGRVLQDVSAPPAGLPQLSVPATPGGPGSVLGSSARPGLAVAASLPAAFAAQVVSVDATKGDQLRLQLTTPISVLLGTPTQLSVKYEGVASILTHAVLHPGDTIDVTVPGSPVVAGP